MDIPRLVITGPSSGVGKTSISCGLIYGLKKSGYKVQPFKVGPDYIDPGYLSHISKRSTRNLDVWLMGKKKILDSFVENSTADVSLIEGVMGYFDGFSGSSSNSSTYHVASILKSPVILVLDAAKTARSIAATALGFKKFQRNSRIQGIILNNLASSRHERLCMQALESVGIPVIGSVPRENTLSLESRHLGLIPTAESKLQTKMITKIARRISEHIDIEKLVRICKTAEPLPKSNPIKAKKPKVTIGVALDDSFNFYYHDNLENLRRQGATIKFFSPTSDSHLPACDGLYLGGGFPEIHGPALSKNRKMKDSVKKFAESERPVYAECGGLMYLTDSIQYDKKNYKMTGLLGGQTVMTKKMKLNYTKASVMKNCMMAPVSKTLQGHEFHYSELRSVPSDAQFAYDLSIGDGIKNKKDGLVIYNTLASYGHLYFDSGNAARLVGNCAEKSRR